MIDLASERAKAEQLAADLALSKQALVCEVAERRKAEAERDEHLSSSKAAQELALDLGRDVELLRGALRGRDAVIDRLRRTERRAWLIAKVRDDLLRLLAKERDPSRHDASRALLVVRRNQAEVLRRAWGEERQARIDLERRLTALERNRVWRLFTKFRAVLGRRPPRLHVAELSALGVDDLTLLSSVTQTGLFDQAYYAECNQDLADQINPALHFARSGWREGRRPNPDFDPADYLARNPDVAAQGINPLVHYADHGLDKIAAALSEDRTPNWSDGLPLGLAEGDRSDLEIVQASFFFDASYYRTQYPDVDAAHKSPAAHYVLMGWRELRNPSADFDTTFYLSQNPDVAMSGSNPLVHFIEVGQAEGRSPNASTRVPAIHSVRKTDLPADHLAAVEAVIGSGLFDANFYRATYPDVVANGQPPAVHFALDGWREGHDPSVAFNTSYYLDQNSDVARSGENPLVHYAHVGAVEGRHPLPEASPDWYIASANERLAQSIRETGLFDEDFYCVHNPDIVERELDPVLHFATWGWKEGRRPHPAFDPKFYLDTNPDVVALGTNPLLHYVQCGIYEGRPSCIAPTPFTHLGYDYARWVKRHDILTDVDCRTIRERIERLSYQTSISIVMSVYNNNLGFLRDAIKSVQAQLYPNWQLYIIEDALTDARVLALLREIADADPRINLVVCERNNHVSSSRNSALNGVTGEFVAFMNQDDVLPQHALFTVAAYLDVDPNIDMIYSDEDRIDANGNRSNPSFKSNYNPELMLGHNMIGHLAIYRKSLLDDIGRFRVDYEDSQDYDLALRVIDASDPSRILHIPHVLYHARDLSGKVKLAQDSNDRYIASAGAAIKDHLGRKGQDGAVIAHPIVPSWHRVLRARPDPAPLVSIIVPTKDKIEILRPCCEGVLRRTDYPNIELIVVDHQSTDSNTLDYLNELCSDGRVSVIPYVGLFNYSSMNNIAVLKSHGSILLFLNNDVEVIAGDWLDEMVALAWLPDVGAVGAKLLYADGRVQHGGVVLGTGGVAGHSFHFLDRDDPGPMGRAVLTSAVSAVTGACLAMRRDVFSEIGGFDEQNLPVTFNDVDLCLKARRLGYRNVLAAQSVLYHYESISRGHDDTPEKAARFSREMEFMKYKWGDELRSDSFYNPNLDLSEASFRFAHPPRLKRPWFEA